MLEEIKSTGDELTPQICTALLEIGLIIPTSSTEVSVAEKFGMSQSTDKDLEASFLQLKSDLSANPKPQITAAKLRPGFNYLPSDKLALAARNGAEIDETLRLRIEADIEAAIKKAETK